MKPVYRQLFWLLVLLLSLGQLQRIELTIHGLPVSFYLHDVFIVGWLVSLRHSLIQRLGTEVWPWVCRHVALRALLGWCLIGMVVNTVLTPSITPWLYVLRALAYGLFTLTLPTIFVKPIEKVDLRERYIVTGVTVALAGFTQYLFLPDTRFLRLFGWDDHYYRLISTLLDPSFTGMLLVLTWTYTQSIDWLYRHRALQLLLSGGLAIAIGLTFSRASYLAFATAVLSSLLLMRAAKQLRQCLIVAGVSALLAIFAVVVAPKPTGEGVDLTRTSTIQSRFTVNQNALRVFTPKTALIGNGLFFTKPTPAAQDHARVPDNLLVMVVQALGVPGLLLVCWLGWQLWYWVLQRDAWMATAFLALLVHSQFNNTLLEPFILLTWLGGLASIGQSSSD